MLHDFVLYKFTIDIDNDIDDGDIVFSVETLGYRLWCRDGSVLSVLLVFFTLFTGLCARIIETFWLNLASLAQSRYRESPPWANASVE